MRCKSTVNVVIKLPPKQAPCHLRLLVDFALWSTNFYLTTVLQVEWGWVRVALQICGDLPTTVRKIGVCTKKQMQNKTKIGKWSLYLPCTPVCHFPLYLLSGSFSVSV